MDRRQFLIGLGGLAAAAGGVLLGLRVLPDEQATALPKIHYGQESCTFCGMSIDDPRFASAWRAANDDRHFDDIGCLVNALRRDHPAGAVEFFVHDFATEEWLDATTATFVVSPTIKTPMAYGVLAISDGSRANALGGATTNVYSWSGLVDNLERRS